MELTHEQEKNLIQALKQYKVAKGHLEAAQKNLAGKFEKLKTCCQGNGPEPQVLATAYELLANIHINKPEPDLE